LQVLQQLIADILYVQKGVQELHHGLQYIFHQARVLFQAPTRRCPIGKVLVKATEQLGGGFPR
jgi:hypothetical protein